MADRSLAIRLAVIDGGKVRAELRDVGETGSRSLQRIEDAAQPASCALQALNGVAGEVRGSLEGMAGRLGPLGAGLARIGPAGLAAAAAIAGVGLALKASFAEAAAAEQSSRRLDAVLKATGYAAGLTAGEIGRFADGIEASTLATAEGVQDAAAILATFRSVSGETFTRALTLAQDMAAVFGQEAQSYEHHPNDTTGARAADRLAVVLGLANRHGLEPAIGLRAAKMLATCNEMGTGSSSCSRNGRDGGAAERADGFGADAATGCAQA